MATPAGSSGELPVRAPKRLPGAVPRDQVADVAAGTHIGDFGHTPAATGTRSLQGMVRIGTGAHTYDWNDNWAAYPVGEGVAEGWVHPGTAWAPSGRLYTGHHALTPHPQNRADGPRRRLTRMSEASRLFPGPCARATPRTDGGAKVGRQVPVSRAFEQEDENPRPFQSNALPRIPPGNGRISLSTAT